MEGPLVLWYSKTNPWQLENVTSFRRMMEAMPHVTFKHANYRAAPWHIQARVNNVTINFWPHLLKGNFEGARAVEGIHALQRLIREAEAHTEFEVVERDTE